MFDCEASAQLDKMKSEKLQKFIAGPSLDKALVF